MRLFSILVFLATIPCGFSQEIIIIDQNGKKVIGPEELIIQIKVDNDSTFEFNLLKDKILIDKSSCNSLAEIKIFGYLTQDYYNQFTPKQFKSIDTIQIYHSKQIVNPTPVFLIDLKQNIDSIIQNNLYFKDYRSQIGLPHSLSFSVFNADKISKKEIKFIEKVKKSYCEKIGIEDEKIKLVFENKPYTTYQVDLFNSGTKITCEFINSQNTDFMKKQAEKYKLVLQLMINWEK